MKDVVNYQIISQAKPLPNAEDLISSYKRLIERFENGLPFVPDTKLPDDVNKVVASLNTPANQPFTEGILVLQISRVHRKNKCASSDNSRQKRPSNRLEAGW